MTDVIAANWWLIVLALVAGLAISWYMFHARRRARVTGKRGDVLDEGAAPAARNQALIDGARASEPSVVPPTAPEAIAGAGEAISAAVEKRQADVAAPSGGDDLTRIKGIGPKVATLLNELGVTRFAQIAAWEEGDIERIDARLGRFHGRIQRDNWVEQARLLENGDMAGYESKFGRLD
ncbi:MAG: hypothetical protein ACR2FJ_07350 [Qipengyuania sp.]